MAVKQVVDLVDQVVKHLGNAGGGQNRNTSGGSGGANGAAIRRISGYNVTINNNGSITGSTTDTGVT